MALTSKSEVTSHFKIFAFLPNFLTFWAIISMGSKSRPANTRFDPALANASVVAAPIPFAGPVIMETRPSRIQSSFQIFVFGHNGCSLNYP